MTSQWKHVIKGHDITVVYKSLKDKPPEKQHLLKKSFLSQTKISSPALLWGDRVDEEILENESEGFYIFPFESGKEESSEEAANRPEAVTPSSENAQSQVSAVSKTPNKENILLLNEQSEVSVAPVTPHSEDVQLVQNHPQASAAQHSKRKFTDSGSYPTPSVGCTQREWTPSKASAANTNYGSEKFKGNFCFQSKSKGLIPATLKLCGGLIKSNVEVWI